MIGDKYLSKETESSQLRGALPEPVRAKTLHILTIATTTNKIIIIAIIIPTIIVHILTLFYSSSIYFFIITTTSRYTV